MANKLNLTRSFELYEQAQQVIPGAILGIRRPYNFVEGEYPIFFDHAKGGRVVDVDGNEYVDMLCAYGPIIIGHQEDEIDQAAYQQISTKGFCMSLTQEVQNRLARKMVELIPCCEKVVFVKTGSDATTCAVRVARGFTEKKHILRCGYHGWHDWCVEVKGGIPEKLYEDVHEFRYNDLEGIKQLLEKFQGDVAGIIMTPLGHPLAAPVEMPKPGFLEEVRKLCNQHETVLIFDEIRTGFRLNIGGGQSEFGVTPDLAVFGKAMGNGYPVGAVTGKAEIMDVLKSKVFLSSTFFPNSDALVAALKTIEIMERDDVLGVIRKKGEQLGQQLTKIIDQSGIDCSLSGAPWMPFISFHKDKERKYKEHRTKFYTGVIRRKVFLQPFHHGYIAYRHTDQDLAQAADAIKESLAELER